ncbi:MAG: hypothetical protein IJU95_07090 [Treponema sp.]|nr:hypothetical protein [Treponema sp.]
MFSPSRSFFRAGLAAATALLLSPAFGEESFDPDSGWGIYSDTRDYGAAGLFDPDAGDGIYSDTRDDKGYYAFVGTHDSFFDADSGEGIYSDTSSWDEPSSANDYPDYWSVPGGDSDYISSGSNDSTVASVTEGDSASADVESVTDSDGVPEDSGASDDEGLWGLFDDAEDTQGVESAPVTAAANSTGTEDKKFEWWGHLNASGGLTFRMFPEGGLSPFATMSNTLGFTARPFDDMVVKGSFYSEFPAFNFDLTSLYFDYIMNDMLYITAGKTGTGWGNSRIFDTNILDDEGDGTVVNPYTDETDTGNRFDAIVTLPIWKGEIQGIGMYAIGDELSRENLALAGKIQYPFGPVSVEVFGKKWATSDRYWMEPAVGVGLSTDLFRNHINLWGMTHFSPDDPMDLGLMRFVGGFSRVIESDLYGKFGLAAEYQMTYDPDKNKDERMTHDIGVTFGWSHAFGSDFSPAVRWWYNPISKQGYVLPSLTFTGLRHVDITLTVPYIFGGATYTNGNSSWSSKADEPLVVFGLIFSISVSY